MKFVVYSRLQMTQVSPPEKSWALISICEDGEFPDVHTNDFMVDRLNLKFHDVDFYKNEDPKKDIRILFNEGHAKQVLNFYTEMRDRGVEVIFIHCLMGMCRSAAIAAALDKVTNGDDHVWFKVKRPNMRVHQTIMREAAERGLI